MATLFAWRFTGALLYISIGDTALTRFVGGSHFTLGFTLFVLVLLRGTWGSRTYLDVHHIGAAWAVPRWSGMA